MVVIHVGDRQGIERPLGAGFIISESGLVASNLHVIGENRPISVELESGEHRPVSLIYAHDRKLDLAILRIPGGGLNALPLGDSDALTQGQPVVALGNPRGLERSATSGLVSAIRKLKGLPMIQLALPIEPGNSGGPLVDLQGRVQGIVSMKSALTPNLGFAVPINALKPLLARPNPVPIERWMTIANLDPQRWTPLFGARWRRRAGRVRADGKGSVFGGRTLCLSTESAPALPYEVEVRVRSDQPDGAAGLALASDGGFEHYGFYLSRGRVRLTRFAGPSVQDWEILFDEHSEHLNPKDWNHLRIRREARRLIGYLNGHELFSIREAALGHADHAQVGLLKFRDSGAEFDRFDVGRSLAPVRISKARLQRTQRLLDASATSPGAKLRALGEDPEALFAATESLRKKLRDAERMQRAVTQKNTLEALQSAFTQAPERIDLFEVAMLIAKLDTPSIDIQRYRGELARMAAQARASAPAGASESVRLRALTRFFIEAGFHGSYDEYYHRSNSYLNQVIDDREGLPISLSVLYICLARALDLNVVGVGLPGHFVVRFIPSRASSQVPFLLDVFNGARPISIEEAQQIAHQLTGARLAREDLKAATPQGIALRMLRNLEAAAKRERDRAGQLRYLDAMLAIDPKAGQARLRRIDLLLRTAPRSAVEADVRFLLEHPDGTDPAALAGLMRVLGQGR